MERFKTNSLINKWNSRELVFNRAGKVIGVVSRTISRPGGYEELGFVVTSKMARQLLEGWKIFWSGLKGYVLTGELARLEIGYLRDFIT